MVVIPNEIEERRDAYCQQQRISTAELIGFGVDGFVWQTNRVSVIKIFRTVAPYRQELEVYLRLKDLRLRKLQGFDIPWLIGQDDTHWILELSFVSPPFVLDFAAASIGRSSGGDASPDWIAEKRRLFGTDWPDVQRLLDALRLYGIHFPDVHKGNIRVRK